jgi:hypothetical protein
MNTAKFNLKPYFPNLTYDKSSGKSGVFHQVAFGVAGNFRYAFSIHHTCDNQHSESFCAGNAL